MSCINHVILFFCRPHSRNSHPKGLRLKRATENCLYKKYYSIYATVLVLSNSSDIWFSVSGFLVFEISWPLSIILLVYNFLNLCATNRQTGCLSIGILGTFIKSNPNYLEFLDCFIVQVIKCIYLFDLKSFTCELSISFPVYVPFPQ